MKSFTGRLFFRLVRHSFQRRRILSMFIVLFTIIVAGCDSTTDGTDQDTAITQDDSGVCGKCQDGQINPNDTETGFCGDGVCGIFKGDTPENCLNCLEDCACPADLVCNDIGTCEADPLADYYWLVGQWKDQETKEVDDITVDGWNKEGGAEVGRFSPCSIGHAIKNNVKDQLLFSGLSNDGGSIQCSGQIDIVNKKNSFTAIYTDTGEVAIPLVIYIKL